MNETGETRVGRMRREWNELATWLRAVIAIGALVAVVAIGSVLWSIIGESRQESAAREACEEQVKDVLKSPATAEFTDTEATRENDYGFTITGAVDSENGFGAMIRNRYECQVQELGDDWVLLNLEFED